MTIEQAKEVLEKWKDRGSDGLTDERLGYIDEWYHKKDDVAFEIAIKSLNMWDKVVEQINTKYGYILKATKYGNENEEQLDFSYSNVLMYEVAEILDDILDDIEKYKKEIEK